MSAYTSCPYLLLVILYASLVIVKVCIKSPNIIIPEIIVLLINTAIINSTVKIIYENIEIHTNCTVIISRCQKCGNIDISWIKNEGCESYDPRTNEPLYGTYEDRNP